MKRSLLPLLVAGALALPGCSSSVGSDRVLESLETVATLRGGTISALRDLRGTGPFRTYHLPPGELVEVVGEAAAFARGRGGQPVKAIFVSKRRGEVVAKERDPEDASSTSYDEPFLSAVVVSVHGVPGQPDLARLEMHATHSGPFHLGAVNWTRDLPVWIDQVLAQRAAEAVSSP
ncbi:MAG: hypothetical protein AB7T63_10965 [Planctomycetota bacterium]